jgi:predicted butyrate kinase (DUF1464 family)
MTLSVGIDYQAASWKVALWDEERVADLHVFTGSSHMWEFLEEVRRAHPAAPAVLPSGFGIPITRAGDLLDQDIAEMTLEGKAQATDELASFLAEARRRLPRAFCIPAVKLLPTIPRHRKVHRIDLGTSDLLCAATWALYCRESVGRTQESSTFLLVNAGSDRRAVLAVVRGRIVDGIGGTAPPMGATLHLDRLATPEGARNSLQTNRPLGAADALNSATDPTVVWESLTKEAYALFGFHRLPEVIVIGERRREAAEALGSHLPLANLSTPVDGYEGALGAAVVAAGLTGGPTADVLERLGLREARERVLDWLTS